MPSNTVPRITVENIGRVGLITLNEPERRNALSLELNEQLIRAMDSLEANSDIGAVVLTGSGRAFCAGAVRGEVVGLHVVGLYNIVELCVST